MTPFGRIVVMLALVCFAVFVLFNLIYSPPLNPAIVTLSERYPQPPDEQNGFHVFSSIKPPQEPWDGQIVEIIPKIWVDNYNRNCWLSARPEKIYRYETVSISLDDDSRVEVPCVPADELVKLLAEEAPLLQKLRTIMAMPRYYTVYTDALLASAYRMIDLQNLFTMGIVHKAQNGQAEEAYRDWALQRRFANTFLADVQDEGDKLVGFVVSGWNLGALEALYMYHPEIAVQHADEILSLLSIPPYGTRDDVMKVFLARYHFLEAYKHSDYSYTNFSRLGDEMVKRQWWEDVFYDGNSTINAIYDHFDAVVSLRETDGAGGCNAFTDLSRRNGMPELLTAGDFAGFAADLFYNPLGKFVAWPAAMYGTGLRSLSVHAVKARALGAVTLGILGGISPAEMPEFLASLPADWQNPLGGVPFGYDTVTNDVTYVLKGCYEEDEGHTVRLIYPTLPVATAQQ